MFLCPASGGDLWAVPHLPCRDCRQRLLHRVQLRHHRGDGDLAERRGHDAGGASPQQSFRLSAELYGVAAGRHNRSLIGSSGLPFLSSCVGCRLRLASRYALQNSCEIRITLVTPAVLHTCPRCTNEQKDCETGKGVLLRIPLRDSCDSDFESSALSCIFGDSLAARAFLTSPFVHPFSYIAVVALVSSDFEKIKV